MGKFALKISSALTVTALVTSFSLVQVAPAAAENGRNAALFGGLAAGAIVGGAIAAGARAPVYAAPPLPPPVYVDCGYERRPVFDRWGNFAGYHYIRICD
jgi:hypothetical protein